MFFFVAIPFRENTEWNGRNGPFHRLPTSTEGSGGLWKTGIDRPGPDSMKNIFKGWDSNPGPPKWKAEAFPLGQSGRLFVNVMF